MSEPLLLLGIVLAAVSGVPGWLTRRHGNAGQWASAVLLGCGSGLGLLGLIAYWYDHSSSPIAWPWRLAGVEFAVGIDGLSAVFLLPIFLISLLGSIYGLDYWKQTEHPDNGRKLRFFYGLLTAGMALLVIARSSIWFLFGWEIMALAAYFLVTTEDHDPAVCDAGWLYLVATHTATLCLFGLFGLMRNVVGSFALAPMTADLLTPGLTTALVVLALAGFGIKAGIMPLHIWLPSSHAIAPSHVSAIMSGVIIKMGIYGLMRFTSLMPSLPPEWGGIVLALGAVSGILGVLFAIGQHDLKRLLAYHSIENIGIIIMGLGLAMLGRSLGRREWVVLGLSGALLHVWNHALFKALLFLGAGSVIHATGTREIDHLGGLAKPMPRTAVCFLVGASAICGLPPLNGFVSEFLIYLGLFRTLQDEPHYAGVALAAPALALIGALALACFVKVFGAVFLGTARSAHAQHAHESSPAMVGPMVVLAACCFLIGIVPGLLAPILDDAVAAWAPQLQYAGPGLARIAPLGWLSILNLMLLAGLALIGWLLWQRLAATETAAAPTWGCGYTAPSPRMQYTSSSFAQLLVGLFALFLRPKVQRVGSLALFPAKAEFHSDVPDPVLEEVVLPSLRGSAWLLSWCRVIQAGSVQSYLLYIFLMLLALLLWR